MIYAPATDIVSADESVRRHARDYILQMLALAAQVGVEIVPITPTACMKTRPEAPIEQEWEWARDTIRVAGEAAEGLGIRVVIEPWNRYETYLINRLDQAVRMAREVDHPNVGVKGDLFHMNIEELDIPASDPRHRFAAVAPRRRRHHPGCAGRRAPRPGRRSWRPWATSALTESSTSSCCRRPATRSCQSRAAGAEEFKDKYTAAAIERLKAIAGQAPVGTAREN